MQPNQRGSFRESSDGFTLIELLIVIVILGILSGIVVFAVASLSGTSAQAACKADYKSVEVAVESYKSQEGLYPTAGSHGVTGTDGVAALLVKDTTVTPNLGPWLRDQPTNGHHYRIEVSTDGNGTVQVYKWDGSATIPSSGTGTVADCSSVTS